MYIYMPKPEVNGGSESSKIIQNHPKSRTRVVFEIHLRRFLLIFTYLFYPFLLNGNSTILVLRVNQVRQPMLDISPSVQTSHLAGWKFCHLRSKKTLSHLRMGPLEILKLQFAVSRLESMFGWYWLIRGVCHSWQLLQGQKGQFHGRPSGSSRLHGNAMIKPNHTLYRTPLYFLNACTYNNLMAIQF